MIYKKKYIIIPIMEIANFVVFSSLALDLI